MTHQHHSVQRVRGWLDCGDAILPIDPLMAVRAIQGTTEAATEVMYSDGRRIRTRASLQQLLTAMTDDGTAVSMALKADPPTEQVP